jgi:hypothetical protein
MGETQIPSPMPERPMHEAFPADAASRRMNIAFQTCCFFAVTVMDN